MLYFVFDVNGIILYVVFWFALFLFFLAIFLRLIQVDVHGYIVFYWWCTRIHLFMVDIQVVSSLGSFRYAGINIFSKALTVYMCKSFRFISRDCWGGSEFCIFSALIWLYYFPRGCNSYNHQQLHEHFHCFICLPILGICRFYVFPSMVGMKWYIIVQENLHFLHCWGGLYSSFSVGWFVFFLSVQQFLYVICKWIVFWLYVLHIYSPNLALVPLVGFLVYCLASCVGVHPV